MPDPLGQSPSPSMNLVPGPGFEPGWSPFKRRVHETALPTGHSKLGARCRCRTDLVHIKSVMHTHACPSRKLGAHGWTRTNVSR